MLEKLFAWNRLQKREPEDDGTWRRITEKDYQRYLFYEELFRKIVATEAALHNMEDPMLNITRDTFTGSGQGGLIG